VTVALVSALLLVTSAAGSARFVRVRVDEANLRTRPTTASDVLRLTHENEPLRVVGARGEWLRVVDYRGRAGWIAAGLTDGGRAAIVRRPLVNVRSGPGTRHDVVFAAERGVSFRVLDATGDWLAVRHEDGDRGWIHESLVWGRW
jgi:SH3-like domain-containing protein